MIRQAEIPVQPFDLQATFEMQVLGKFDPTARRTATSITKAHHDGEGRLLIWRFTESDESLVIELEGGDDAQLQEMALQFPLNDGAETFTADHPLLDKLSNALRGLRIMRMPWTFDIVAGSILQQRVTWQRGYTEFKKVALRWGTRVHGGVAFPSSTTLAGVPIYRLEAIGIDPKRAATLHRVACEDARHGFLRPDAEPSEMAKRLFSIRGIGPWTVGRTLGLAYGDTDAVILADLHIPTLVTTALGGEPEGTDERMLQLLEPYKGQRFRVIRLLQWAARRAPHVFSV